MAEQRQRGSRGKPTPPAEAKPPEPQRVAPDLSRERSLAERPLPGERRGSRIPPVIATLLLAGAAVIAIILIVGGDDDDENATIDTPSPPSVAITPSAPARGKARTPATPAGEPGQRAESCEPIIGSGTANSGQTYAVTSSATDGDPADCIEARSVLLSALSGGATAIGGWRCTTDLSSPTIASCTSVGGRKIRARG